MSDNEEKSFPDKWLKKLPTGWQDDADAMDDDDLKKVIVQSEGNIYTIDNEKEADVKLNAARSVIKDLGAPYREAKTAQTAKIKYALWLLENRGVSLNKDES